MFIRHNSLLHSLPEMIFFFFFNHWIHERNVRKVRVWTRHFGLAANTWLTMQGDCWHKAHKFFWTLSSSACVSNWKDPSASEGRLGVLVSLTLVSTLLWRASYSSAARTGNNTHTHRAVSNGKSGILSTFWNVSLMFYRSFILLPC